MPGENAREGRDSSPLLGHTESDSYQMGMKTGKRGIREMARRLGQRTYQFTQPISITASAAIGSKKESEGPMAEYFDTLCPNSDFGGEHLGKGGEPDAKRDAVAKALEKAGGLPRGKWIISLLGICSTSVSAPPMGCGTSPSPFLGAYGACSTMAESLGVSRSVFGRRRCFPLCGGHSSHFCSAERQFRFPLEYGGQRPPTSQWTVTGGRGGLCAGYSGGRAPF